MERTDDCLNETPYGYEPFDYYEAWEHRDTKKYPVSDDPSIPEFMEAQKRWLKDLGFEMYLDCEKLKCIHIYERELTGNCKESFSKNETIGDIKKSN